MAEAQSIHAQSSETQSRKTLLFIGGGRMGAALASGLVRAGWAPGSIAIAEKDQDAVSTWWEYARERCPDFALAYTAGAEAARLAGRENEADQILELAVTRLRYDLGVHLEYARSRNSRSGGKPAAERWALVHERFPECEEARTKQAAALAEIADADSTA